jgi:hypothetical protein
MKQILPFLLISIFSIFIGSQITEGALLVPYWQSLSSDNFYAYYNEHGPLIGQFYTLLTIIAALIPIIIAIYCKSINSKALKFALTSSFFALLFVSSFYMYFKGTNDLFYRAALADIELKKELISWSYWHWGRILMECLSLLFLMLTFSKIKNINDN